MRILFIVTAYKRHEEDVITPWMTGIILQLKARGVDVEVFAPSYKGLGDQTVDGIRIRRFRYFLSRWEDLTHDETTPDRVAKGIFYKLLVVAYLVGGVIGMIRLCRKERYDIFQTHWPFPHFLFARVGKWLTGGRIVSSFHGVEVRWVRRKLPFLRFLLTWAIRNSQAVTSNTRTTADEIRSIRETAVEVIPYSIGLTGRSRKSPGVSGKNDPVGPILFVGRLVERKGVDVLLKALQKVREAYDARAVIIGEGSEREGLVKMAAALGIESSVTFPGFVGEDELIACFETCSMFVLPAVYDRKGDTEGQGVVLIEAMSFKVPVIASGIGGIRDVVRDGETGILVRESDPEDLSAAILTLLTDREKARSMGLKGYDLYLSTYHWDAITDRWMRVYRKVVES